MGLDLIGFLGVTLLKTNLQHWNVNSPACLALKQARMTNKYQYTGHRHHMTSDRRKKTHSRTNVLLMQVKQNLKVNQPALVQRVGFSN